MELEEHLEPEAAVPLPCVPDWQSDSLTIGQGALWADDGTHDPVDAYEF